MKKTLHLVCNAHIDPAWLWNWQEGLAETLSTFRTAAGFCDELDGFVFCHGESLLYEWTEEYEPELFARIRRLAKAGRWHIMGGWYVQPDCNIPSGESFVRQILTGKKYFIEKFGVEPRTAINFDPFGHSRGLIQILKKSGYSSYLFCRPDGEWLRLPADDFIWKGFDSSEIIAHRAEGHYNSEFGKAAIKIEQWLAKNQTKKSGLLLWGIGNHGGGPSRQDLEAIEKIMRTEEIKETGSVFDIRHSTPEDYFDTIDKEYLPVFSGGLNPWAVGCYTTMARVKQMHRRLESQYFVTENMVAIAALQGSMDYPRAELDTALKDLLFCQFHDILPGTSISEVEEYAIQKMGHALEILSRLKTKAFFGFLAGRQPASNGEFPIFVYNHHPFEHEATIVCELQPAEPNLDDDTFLMPEFLDPQGNRIRVQLEKESSNIMNDHRKRVLFSAKLNASSMNRFSCYLREIEMELKPEIEQPKSLVFNNGRMEIEIDIDTGLIGGYNVNDVACLLPDALRLLVIRDNPDPWGMKVSSFRDVIGEFKLMTKAESTEFAGTAMPGLEPVRVVEDGPIRTVVEALFKYNHSAACVRYGIPISGSEIEIELIIYSMEKDKMIKLSIPSRFPDGNCCGQVAFGVEQFGNSGSEYVAQRWIAITQKENTLTIINDGTHGFDYTNGELRLSLLRTPAYAGHPVEGAVEYGQSGIVLQDRFEPRIDQGERRFRFWLNAGPSAGRLASINREAKLRNEPLMALCCFPPGQGNVLKPGVQISDENIELPALKMSEDGNKLILRLFEPTGTKRWAKVTIPFLGKSYNISLDSFELKTIAIDIESKSLCETDLLERRMDG